MVLNVLFLAGGICVGYLVRGEIDRRKSKKALSSAIEEGIKIAEKWVSELSDKKEDDENEEDNVINLDSLNEFINISGTEHNSNSTDETIQL